MMVSTVAPRIVVVTRLTEYQWLLRRHATSQQARFYLETRGQSMDDVLARHEKFESTLHDVMAAVPADWRSTHVQRGDLDRFLFEPNDVVVALGQDGLVANLAKYLTGQPVIGLNPLPDRYEGILVPHAPTAALSLMRAAAIGQGTYEARTMVAAEMDDGRQLLALNEIYIGHRTHQSSRYHIHFAGAHERQSSSGLIVATGTGTTGWARSIALERHTAMHLPSPADPQLIFFVREAWPSVSTGVGITEGLITPDHTLKIVSRMDDDGVIFGDGIEADYNEFGWGRRVKLHLAKQHLNLMTNVQNDQSSANDESAPMSDQSSHPTTTYQPAPDDDDSFVGATGLPVMSKLSTHSLN